MNTQYTIEMPIIKIITPIIVHIYIIRIILIYYKIHNIIVLYITYHI